MTTVGIRALKSQLSKYVAKAVAGETVIVADRGTPVAMLCPLPRSLRVVEDLRGRGIVQWSGKKPKFARRKRWQSGDPDPGIAKRVVEDRR